MAKKQIAECPHCDNNWNDEVFRLDNEEGGDNK